MFNTLVYNVDNTEFHYNSQGELTACYSDEECVNIPEEILGVKIKSIGLSAFCKLNQTKEVNIPDSVTRLKKKAFYGCVSLEKVKLSSNLQHIGKEIFGQCTSLTEVSLAEDNPYFILSEGIIYNKERTRVITALPYFKGSCTLPDEVIKIKSLAFEGCVGLTEIKLPAKLNDIGKYAFADCSNLKEISIPSSLTKIKEGTFSYCTALNKVDLPSSIRTIGTLAFSDCYSLKTIALSENVKKIKEGAFRASGLTEITLPEGLVKIEKEAFMDCEDLTKVTLPDSVKLIEYSSFKVPDKNKVIFYARKGTYGAEWAEKNGFKVEYI